MNFFDKATIPDFKKERISNADKLFNINEELDGLNDSLTRLSFSRDDVVLEVSELKKINEVLWMIEDDICEQEPHKIFDDKFIELARAVYISNNKRCYLA